MNTQAKKKVLYLITKSNWGGAQRYVFDLATNLPPAYEPVVALGGGGVLIERLETAGIRVIRIPGLQRDISPKKELQSTRAIARIIKQERPDVLHINSSKAGGIGTLLGRWYRVPRIIFTAHGWAFNEDRSWFSRQMIACLHWLTVISSHATIAVSHGLKQQLRWPGAQRKMHVIHPGRDMPHVIPHALARQQLIDRYPQLAPYQNDIWIGTIAELHPIKRHHVTIDALADLVVKHPHLRYIVFGEGEERASLEALIRERHLEQHVFLLGHHTGAAELLPAFDMFVLASKSESYGYVLVEAGLARLPIVATRTGGITDLITHEENGLLVPPNSCSKLRAAIARLIQDQELSDRLAMHHQEAMQKKNTATMLAATTALYERR